MSYPDISDVFDFDDSGYTRITRINKDRLGLQPFTDTNGCLSYVIATLDNINLSKDTNLQMHLLREYCRRMFEFRTEFRAAPNRVTVYMGIESFLKRGSFWKSTGYVFPWDDEVNVLSHIRPIEDFGVYENCRNFISSIRDELFPRADRLLRSRSR